VPEPQLNLLELAAGLAAELGAGAAQVMRREFPERGWRGRNGPPVATVRAAERESAYVIDGLMHNEVVKSDIHLL